MSNDNNLQSHITATQNEIHDAERIAAAQQKRRASARSALQTLILRVIAVIAVIGWAAVLFWQKDELRYWLAGPSIQTVRADLESLLAETAQEVDAYRERTGALPDQLPNPALANLVTYRLAGDDHYILKATLGPVTQEQSY